MKVTPFVAFVSLVTSFASAADRRASWIDALLISVDFPSSQMATRDCARSRMYWNSSSDLASSLDGCLSGFCRGAVLDWLQFAGGCRKKARTSAKLRIRRVNLAFI